MAVTSYGVNDAEAVKLWSRKLSREALKLTYASRFMGTDSNALCREKDDTKKSAGDRVRSILRMQLSGAGIQGDGTLEGNEEDLTTYTDDLVISGESNLFTVPDLSDIEKLRGLLGRAYRLPFRTVWRWFVLLVILLSLLVVTGLIVKDFWASPPAGR